MRKKYLLFVIIAAVFLSVSAMFLSGSAGISENGRKENYPTVVAAEADDIRDATVTAVMRSNGTAYYGDWTTNNIVITLSNSLAMSGVIYQYKIDSLGEIWANIAGDTLTVSRSSINIGIGDQYSFRFVKDGVYSQETVSSTFVRLDKKEINLAVNIINNPTGNNNPAPYTLKIEIDVPACGIRSVSFGGISKTIANPAQSVYTHTFTGTGTQQDNVSVIDNMNNTVSASYRIHMAGGGNSFPTIAVAGDTGSEISWKKEVTLTISGTLSDRVTYLGYSTNGISFTDTGYRTTSTSSYTYNFNVPARGAYWFRVEQGTGNNTRIAETAAAVRVDYLDNTPPELVIENYEQDKWMDPDRDTLGLIPKVGGSGISAFTVSINGAAPEPYDVVQSPAYSVAQSGLYTFSLTNGVGDTITESLNVRVEMTDGIDISVSHTPATLPISWTNSPISFTLTSVKSATAGGGAITSPLTYYYCISDDEVNDSNFRNKTWVAMSGNTLNVNWNVNGYIAFRAESPSEGLMGISQNSYRVMIDCEAPVFNVVRNWSQNYAIFVIYSENTLCEYTIQYKKTTDSTWTTITHADDFSVWYVYILVGNSPETYEIQLTKEFSGEKFLDTNRYNVERDDTVLNPELSFAVTKNVASNVWATSVRFEIHCFDEKASGVIYQYKLGSGGVWTAMSSNALTVDASIIPGTFSGNVYFQARRGAGAEDSWVDLQTGEVNAIRIDNLIGAQVTDSASGYTSQPIALSIGLTNGGSGFGTAQVTLPDGSIRILPAITEGVLTYSTTFSVSANGTYSFRFTNGAGAASIVPVTVTRFDNTSPVFTIVPTGFTQNVWTNNDATFTVYNPTVPVSEVTYYYSTDNGSTWPATQVLTDIGSGVFSHTIAANFDRTVMFKAVSGSNVEYILSIFYQVKIDKTTPSFTITATATEDDDVFLAKIGTAATNISPVRYYYLGQAGQNLNREMIVGNEITISGNGTHLFKAVSGADLEGTFQYTISTTALPDPAFTVSAPAGWQKANYTFTFAVAEGVTGEPSYTYYFRRRAESADWNGELFTAVTGNSLTVSDTSGSFVYEFYAVYTTGTAKKSAVITRTVRMDKTTPTLSVTGNPASGYYATVTLSLTAGFGLSGGRIEVTVYNGSTTSYVTTTVSSTSGTSIVIDYVVTVNDTYTFRAVSGAGNQTTDSDIIVNRIDTIYPDFTVVRSNATPENWTYTAEVFTITPTKFPVSNAEYFYSINGGTPTEITATDGNGNYLVTANTNGSNVYIFYGKSGRGLETVSAPYTVKFDSTQPSLSVTGQPTGNIFMESVLLTARATFGVSGGKVTVDGAEIGVSSVAGTFSYNFTVSAAKNYTVAAISVAGKTTSHTESAGSYIDTATPDLNVAHTGTLNAWTNQAVVFTISSSAVTSGVSIYYSKDNKQSWTEIPLNAGKYTLTASTQGVTEYYFEVISGSLITVISSSPYTVKYDSTTPSIAVSGRPASGVYVQSVQLTATATFGASGGTVTAGGTTIGSSAVAGTFTYNYTVSEAQNYTFTITSNVPGVSASVTENAAVYIDITDPTFSVTHNKTTLSDWVATAVVFTITPQATLSASVIYSYSKDGGLNWTPLTKGAAETVYTLTANILGTTNYKFKAVSGSGRTVDHPTTYTVKFDDFIPALTVTGQPTTSYKQSVLLTLTTTFGVSGGKVTYGNTEIGANAVAGTFTYYYTVNTAADYTFKAESGAGLVKNHTENTRGYIDVTAPEFTVVVSGSITGWTSTAVVFTVTPNSAPTSTAVYSYSTDGLNWTDLTKEATDTVYTLTANISGITNYKFKAVSGSGMTEQDPTTYTVKYDGTMPTLTVTGQPATGVYKQSVQLTLTATFGASGGKVSYGTTEIGSNAAAGTFTYYYIVNTAADYVFTAESVAGLTKTHTEDTRGYIDTVAPTFGVAVSGNSEGWVSTAVIFTVTPQSAPTSNAVYSYSTDGGLNWTDLTKGATDTVYTLTANISGITNYKFKAVSGSDKTIEHPTTYTVKFDDFTPTLTVTGQPAAGVYKQSVQLTLTATFGASGGKVTYGNTEIGVSLTAGTFTYNYTVSSAVDYNFTVVSGANLSASKTERAGTYIDTAIPIFAVDVSGNISGWTSTEVVFTLIPAVTPVSNAIYSYSTDDGANWTKISYSSGAYTLTANTPGEKRYIFRAVSGSEVYESPQRTYTVKYDAEKPVIDSITNTTTAAVLESELAIAVTLGISGGTVTVTFNGETLTVGSNLAAGTHNLRYRISKNGTYVINVTSAASESDSGTVTVTNIDDADPVLTITYDGRIGSWTADEIIFEIEPPVSGRSTTYWYSTDDFATAGTQINISNGKYLLKVTQTGDYIIRFKAVSETGRTTLSRTYIIRYDDVMPTLDVAITDGIEGNYSESVTISVTSVFGVSGGIVTVSCDGVQIGEATQNFIVLKNGNYVFTATNGAGKFVTRTQIINIIDNSAPRFSVAATVPKGWTAEGVRFIITPTETPLSGARYYCVVGENEIPLVFDDEIGAYTFTADIYGDNIYTFKAVSGLGRVALYDPFNVKFDDFVPLISIEDDSGTEPRNTDIVLTVKGNYGGLASGYVWVSVDNGDYTKLVTDLYIVERNGTYRFKAESETGLVSDVQIFSVNYILKQGPQAVGVVNNTEYGSVALEGENFKSDVKITANNYSRIEVKRNSAAFESFDKLNEFAGTTSFGTQYFVEGSLLFSANGSYEVTFYDDAGNFCTIRFFINKPNYALIVGVSVGSVAVAAFVAWLVLMNIKNKKALKRLVGAATVSDDANKFVMFKKIK